MIGLNVFFENALGRVIELVRVTPDSVTLFHISYRSEAFEQRVIRQIFFVVAVRDDVTGVTGRTSIQIRGIQAQKLGFADLLCVAE